MNARLVYFLREAMGSFKRNWVMSFAAITTVAVSLLVLGAFFILSLSLGSLIKSAEKEVGLVQVFLEDTASVQDVNVLQDRVLSWPEVETVSYVSKDQALERMKETFKDTPEMIEAMSGNPLPASLEIRVKDSEEVKGVVNRVNDNQEVIQDVKYAEEVIDRLFAVTRASRIIGIIFISLLIFAALVLIVNTIRLAIFARRREIAIMKLVGASNWFIRWPFLLEGVFQGLVGAVLAVAAIYLFQQTFVSQAARSLSFLPVDFNDAAFFRVLIYLTLAGIFVGATGSTIALRRFLKV